MHTYLGEAIILDVVDLWAGMIFRVMIVVHIELTSTNYCQALGVTPRRAVSFTRSSLPSSFFLLPSFSLSLPLLSFNINTSTSTSTNNTHIQRAASFIPSPFTLYNEIPHSSLPPPLLISRPQLCRPPKRPHAASICRQTSRCLYKLPSRPPCFS